jgi:hypothetical protein
MLEADLDESLARSRYAQRAKRSGGDSEGTASVTGHRHGHKASEPPHVVGRTMG